MKEMSAAKKNMLAVSCAAIVLLAALAAYAAIRKKEAIGTVEVTRENIQTLSRKELPDSAKFRRAVIGATPEKIVISEDGGNSRTFRLFEYNMSSGETTKILEMPDSLRIDAYDYMALSGGEYLFSRYITELGSDIYGLHSIHRIEGDQLTLLCEFKGRFIHPVPYGGMLVFGVVDLDTNALELMYLDSSGEVGSLAKFDYEGYGYGILADYTDSSLSAAGEYLGLLGEGKREGQRDEVTVFGDGKLVYRYRESYVISGVMFSGDLMYTVLKIPRFGERNAFEVACIDLKSGKRYLSSDLGCFLRYTYRIADGVYVGTEWHNPDYKDGMSYAPVILTLSSETPQINIQPLDVELSQTEYMNNFVRPTVDGQFILVDDSDNIMNYVFKFNLFTLE